MHKSLIALNALLAALAIAHPTASTESKCVNGLKTVKINFDHIRPNSEKPPPDGLGGLDFTGWSIYAVPGDCEPCLGPDAKGHNFTGASSPNILRGDPPNPLIMTAHDQTPFRLKGFDLACYDFISDLSLKPIKCAPLVTASNPYGVTNSTTETIMLDYAEDDFNHPQFVTFEGPTKFGTEVLFALPGPPVGKYKIPADTVVNIDNLVIERKC